MPMTHEQFVNLVNRLEGLAQRNPGSYRLRLGLLAALGYAYILLLLGIAVGLLGAIIWYFATSHRAPGGAMRVVIPLVVFIGIVLRSLWVSFPRPGGLELRRSDAPELFAVVDDLCKALRAPRPAHVLLNDDYNAAVAQMPRLGVLGWDQGYLMLGLPYMQSKSPEEFRATLAHEIGHLSGNHGRFGVWIARVRSTWGRLTEELSEKGYRGAVLFTWFSKWYAPYFMAYSFVVVRAQEREADNYASKLVGARDSARNLVASAVWAGFLNAEFWPAVYRRVNDLPAPPSNAFTDMMQALRRPLQAEQADKWLLEALGPETGVDDTHPSLRDRIAGLGYKEARSDAATRQSLLPVPLEVTAAERFLGERLATYASILDSVWARGVGAAWAERHRAAQQAHAEIEELTQRALQGPLPQEEAWRRVRLIAEFDTNEQAMPLLREMLERWPDFAPAEFALGQCLLEQDDPSGVQLIEEAMAKDQDFVLPGCEAIHGFLSAKGRNEEAAAYLKRGMERYAVVEAAEREEQTFTKRDVLLPPDLSDEVLQAVRAVVSGHPEIAEAYLVRKQLRTEIGKPSYVLGLVPKFKGLIVDYDKASKELLQRVLQSGHLPIEMTVVILTAGYSFLTKRMRKINGALVYRKQK